jgi:hypothetical protein
MGRSWQTQSRRRSAIASTLYPTVSPSPPPAGATSPVALPPPLHLAQPLPPPRPGGSPSEPSWPI